MAENKNNTTVVKDKVFGFGYSDLASQLMSNMDYAVDNPSSISRYTELLNDETISTGLEYLCNSVVSKIKSYSHDDERIKAYVDSCLEQINGTIEDARSTLLRSALCYGFGVSEFTLSSVNGQWLLSSLPSYDPTTIKFKFGRGADNATIITSIQQTAGGVELNIPAEKAIVLRFGSSSNPYGISRLARCWRWFVFKKTIPKFWAVALERYGMPTIVGKSDDTETMCDVLKDSYSKAYFSIGRDDSIEALQTEAGIGTAYADALEFCNKMLYRAMFIPALLGGGEGGGSYSLGEIQWQMFDDSCMWLAREFAEAELEQLWKPLIQWNFGPQDNYGILDVSNTDSPARQLQLAQIFASAVNSGFVYPDEGDAKWLRERLNFPEEEAGEKVPWRNKFSRTPSSGGVTGNPSGEQQK